MPFKCEAFASSCCASGIRILDKLAMTDHEAELLRNT
jgi:hypothetical protein